MKKLLALLLAFVMLFSVATLFAGCEDSGKKKSSSSKRDDDEEDDEDDSDDGDDGTSDPSGSEPTTGEPTTGEPTTGEPTTGEPTTGEPTTGEPTTGEPATGGSPTTPPATEQKDVLLRLQESIDAYVEAATGKGTSKLERLAPNEYWSANGYTISEIHATFPDAYAYYANGEILEARCTLISYELLDATETAQIAENLENVGLDANKVEATATVVGNMYSTNGIEVVENQQTVYGVCYDGQWYVMVDEETLFGEFIIYIMDRYAEKSEEGLREGDLSQASLSLGDYMYDFTVTTAGGEEITLSQVLQEKKAVILNFWFASCGPCKKEFPVLQEAYLSYQDDIEIIALDPLGESDDIPAYQENMGLTFPMAGCPMSWAGALDINGYPTTVVIDRTGRIVLMEVGAVTNLDVWMNMMKALTADDYTSTIYDSLSDFYF